MATSTPSSSSSPPKESNTVRSKLTDLRFHFLGAIVIATAFLSLLTAGPSFKTVVSFFSPLLLSTGFFLAVIVVVRIVSPLAAESDGGEGPGSDLIDYVAGPTHLVEEEEEEEEERERTLRNDGEEEEEESGGVVLEDNRTR